MRPRTRDEALFLVLALLIPTAFLLYSRHVWEDYYITFRHGWNLLHGHGLVFNPGERVHGFTSPIGVLLPTLCCFFTGSTDHVPGLWLFRGFCIAAFAAAGLILFRRFQASGSRAAAWAFAILFLCDAKCVDNTINGQETAFMLLCTAALLELVIAGETDRWLFRGLCWAGLMWTRPDGCVYVAVLGAVSLVFDPAPARRQLASLGKSALVCTLLYGPWFLFTGWYYGSFIPHTIKAKGLSGDSYLLHLMGVPGRFKSVGGAVFSSIYTASLFPVGKELYWRLVTHAFELAAVCASAYWLVPVDDRPGRAASLAFALLTLYLSAIRSVFPWYLPPVALCGFVALTRAVPALARRLADAFPGDPVHRRLPALAGLVLAAAAGWQVLALALTAREVAVQQRVVENGNRTRVGLWLKEHVKPGERVYLEPLGYIGFFSEARMLDYPGLASPEVLRARKEHPDTFVDVARTLAPEWLVLRPGEVRQFGAWPEFASRYEPVQTFDVRPELDREGFVPGITYLQYDAHFTVYRRL